MGAIITIPTQDNSTQDYSYEGQRHNVGHFKSDAILLIEGASRSGGPGGWAVGGWDETAEGRIEHGGPMVRGPYAYIIGLSSVIDNYGGTGTEWRRAEESGRLFRLRAGDKLSVNGTVYVLKLDKGFFNRGYPVLEKVA